ncbi:MAG: ATP-binding cassette domain-containing protein [bacterium]|nr:ATP-binding cassette domain-containing protein [bacterium]
MTTTHLLKVEEGCWGYHLNGDLFAPARPVDFEIAAGEILLLTGDNGCGKTTILRGLLGLVRRKSGRIAWGVERDDLGYVPQESVIDRSVPATALDIVRSGDPTRWSRGRDAALEALGRVDLAERADTPFASLSGGQRQRALVARALIGAPRLLLMDEPTINVDAPSARRIGDLLRELSRSRGLGMVITCHVKTWIDADREVPVRAEVTA